MKSPLLSLAFGSLLACSGCGDAPDTPFSKAGAGGGPGAAGTSASDAGATNPSNGSGGAAGGAAATGGATTVGGAGIAGSSGTAGSGSLPVTGQFNHPGALDSKADLDAVKAKIAAGAQPWKGEYDKAKSSAFASMTPHPMTTLNAGDDAQANTSRDDAIGAYTQALLWYYSGDEAYAKGSVAILNAWADLQTINAPTKQGQEKLQAGWIGAVFAPAAEIMRGYSGWSAPDIAKLQAMFKRAFYPQLNEMSTWNGNVDLTQIDAMLNIAVFNDDKAEFDAGVERWHARSRAYFFTISTGMLHIAGDGNNIQAFWGNPSKWVDGLTQETCRDNGHHAQFALGSAIHAAEVAYNQGIDLYTAEQPRFVAALELMATQLLTGEMQGTCANDVATADRFDTWEVAYHHYHERKGVSLPQTAALIQQQIRPMASRTDWNLVYETLTHAGQ